MAQKTCAETTPLLREIASEHRAYTRVGKACARLGERMRAHRY